MKAKTLIILLVSHIAVAVLGFAAGIFALPILIAPPAPETSQVKLLAEQNEFTGEFRTDLTDSDFLHQGEGQVTVGHQHITFMGNISPGPDYRLYLSPEFVQTEAEFLRLKSTMVQVSEVNTFNNFVVPVGTGIDVNRYNTVVVWCESFNQFITAAQYQP